MDAVAQEDRTELGDDLIARLWQPRFPSPELVEQAADLLPSDRSIGGRDQVTREGPQWEITIAPGMIAVGSKDHARAERRYERQLKAKQVQVDQVAAELARTGEMPADPEPSREITGWSGKSRSNMLKTLSSLDYSPMFKPNRLPAMITLTYPGCWLRVAPNGKTVKQHLLKFRKRYERAWGEKLVAVWKLEFQGRRQWVWAHGERVYNWCDCDHCSDLDDGRAPHFHLLMAPPHGHASGMDFRTWLSETWADIVAHPDPEQRKRHRNAGTRVDWDNGLRSTDPKRVSIYFLKHGAFSAKEYQHCVPNAWREPGQGPGAFWRYWHLEPATATRHVSPEAKHQTSRLLRRWARAQGTTRQVSRPRVEQSTGRIRYRKTRVPVKRLSGGAGWVAVNDGAAFASQIARYLADEVPETAEQRRARLVAATGSIHEPASSDTQPATR